MRFDERNYQCNRCLVNVRHHALLEMDFGVMKETVLRSCPRDTNPIMAP